MFNILLYFIVFNLNCEASEITVKRICDNRLDTISKTPGHITH